MKSKGFSAVVLLMLSGAAWAQMTPQQQANLPPSNPNSSQYNTVYLPSLENAAPPQERWADRWGAIATDDNGTAGIVTDITNKRDAQRSAIAECENRGGGNCKVSLAYHNQCAAVAASSSMSFSSSAPTIEEATERSMERCKSAGGECWVYYSGCSLPVRVN